jgi:hypothetical protein
MIADAVNARTRPRGSTPLPVEPPRNGTTQTFVYVLNSSGATAEKYSLLALGGIIQNYSGPQSAEFWRTPILIGELPAWPADSSNVVVCYEPIENGRIGKCVVSGWATAQVNNQSSGNLYCDIDPANPRQFKASTGGPHSVIGGRSSDGLAVVDISSSQQLWKYELTGTVSGGVANAKIIDLNGAVFSASGQVVDQFGALTDAEIGDSGHCIQANDKFYVLSATTMSVTVADIPDMLGRFTATTAWSGSPKSATVTADADYGGTTPPTTALTAVTDSASMFPYARNGSKGLAGRNGTSWEAWNVQQLANLIKIQVSGSLGDYNSSFGVRPTDSNLNSRLDLGSVAAITPSPNGILPTTSELSTINNPAKLWARGDDWVICALDQATGQYFAIAVQRAWASIVRGLSTTAFTRTSLSVNLDGLVGLDGGTPTSATIEASNLLKFGGVDNSACIAIFDALSEQWILVAVQTEQQKVITDLRINEYDIEYKSRNVNVLGGDTETAWTLLADGEACS